MHEDPSRDLSEPRDFRPEEAFVVEGIVVAVIPEFHQARVRTAEGSLLAITRHTAGLHFGDLLEGQLVGCEVTRRFPRVLRAWLVR